jgi:hypothetical protein
MTAGTLSRELDWTNQKVLPANIIPPWFFKHTYITRGLKNRPVGGQSSEI